MKGQCRAEGRESTLSPQISAWQTVTPNRRIFFSAKMPFSIDKFNWIFFTDTTSVYPLIWIFKVFIFIFHSVILIFIVLFPILKTNGFIVFSSFKKIIIRVFYTSSKSFSLEAEWQQVSFRILLSILTNFNSAVFWIVSFLLLISCLSIVQNSTIGITVTLMSHRFFSYQVRSR